MFELVFSNLGGLILVRILKKNYAQTLILVNLIVVICFSFFAHNSAPRRLTGTRIGGNESYRPPGPFLTKMFKIEPLGKHILQTKFIKQKPKTPDIQPTAVQDYNGAY